MYVECSFQSLAPIEDFKTLLIKQLKPDPGNTAAAPLLTLEICTLITQYIYKS